jgi:hypothetical protein
MIDLMLRNNSVSSNSQSTDEDASKNRKEISDIVCHDCQHAVGETWSVKEIRVIGIWDSTHRR